MGYGIIVAVAYAIQTRMLFPTGQVTTTSLPTPATAAPLELETPDGERLRGVHIPPAVEPTNARLLVLGFGGNAWNADDVAMYLHDVLPMAHVAAFHYRGYRPSSGRPSAAAILADAPLIHDHVVETINAEHVIAVGFSIGAGVAADLASSRSLDGLILVTPFDSLEALAREHFPWLPVRWILRHRMSPAQSLQGMNVPTVVLAAGRDTIVPPRRTEALRQAVSNLVLDRTIQDADHNNLYAHPEFRAAMAHALERMAFLRLPQSPNQSDTR